MTRMAMGLAVALVLAGCSGSGGSIRNGDPTGEGGEIRGESNLSVLLRLSGSVADSVLEAAGDRLPPRVRLRVEPNGSWFVFDAFARALSRRGATVVAQGSDDSTGSIDVNVVEAATVYAHARRSWLLGPSEVERSIRVQLRIRVEHTDPLRSVSTGQAVREQKEMIASSAAASLETPGIPATQGTLPEGGWINDFAEPIIVAAAVVVAVVLLFTVRS